jgi:hypothetical protein
MPRNYLFGSKKREALWLREKHNAQLEGRGDHPICNLCGEPVTLDQAKRDGWHESHDPAKPKCFGGKSVGVAHVACNLKHGREVVVPMLAKSNRVIAMHTGSKGPGRGRHPMPHGRLMATSRTIGGKVKPRQTLSEKIAAMREKRLIVADDQPCGGSSASEHPAPTGRSLVKTQPPAPTHGGSHG